MLVQTFILKTLAIAQAIKNRFKHVTQLFQFWEYIKESEIGEWRGNVFSCVYYSPTHKANVVEPSRKSIHNEEINAAQYESRMERHSARRHLKAWHAQPNAWFSRLFWRRKTNTTHAFSCMSKSINTAKMVWMLCHLAHYLQMFFTDLCPLIIAWPCFSLFWLCWFQLISNWYMHWSFKNSMHLNICK